MMWTEADTIWDIAESEHKGEVGLYDLAPDKIREKVHAIRDRLIAEKKASAQEAMETMQLGVDPEAEPEPEEDPEQEPEVKPAA